MKASRFPNKPMELINGMPMIGHCYHRTALALGYENTYVATCDVEILRYIESIGGYCIMTSKDHSRATSRSAEALEKIELSLDSTMDIVVMVQGDEPLIMPEVISELPNHFSDPAVSIVNVMSKFSSYDQFSDPNNVKVVFDENNNALYFSRETIPSPWKGVNNLPMYMQTGVIAFRREKLLEFNQMPETLLEKIESIDMNRILELGQKVRMVGTDSITIGVDTLSDLQIAEELMIEDVVKNLYQSNLTS